MMSETKSELSPCDTIRLIVSSMRPSLQRSVGIDNKLDDMFTGKKGRRFFSFDLGEYKRTVSSISLLCQYRNRTKR